MPSDLVAFQRRSTRNRGCAPPSSTMTPSRCCEPVPQPVMRSQSSAALASTASARVRTAPSLAIPRSAGRRAIGAAAEGSAARRCFSPPVPRTVAARRHALVDIVRAHFGLPSVPPSARPCTTGGIAGTRLGELAPAIMAAARQAMPSRAALVERLAAEFVSLVRTCLPRSRRSPTGLTSCSAAACSRRQRSARAVVTAPPATPSGAPGRPSTTRLSLGAVLVALDAAGALPTLPSGSARLLRGSSAGRRD